ncbi:peroxiredoxin [Candidatus Aerophobetes bacterium]|uniref:Peroxiredoxin n=1 Tax=Aerophobetes bacterium TaxID=2030807 RepID=A0A523QII9_UNCAE|nr:MAG: peroxiredoxin [Candidatus Aerophobetes bacterium]
MDIGDKAPDFELPSTEGKNVRLKDELGKGNILLLFYPFAFSSVCTAEMCSIRDGMTEFTAVKAKVFGISVDSPYAQKAWVQQLNLNFPLLSDFNKEVSKAYEVLYEDLGGLKGVAKRSVFVLDREGIIGYKWVSEDPKKLPNLEAIKKVLR